LNLEVRALAAGTRAAGTVIAFGYLLGFVSGPLIGVMGGLALISLGRSLTAEGDDAAAASAAFAVLAGAFGVAALRWKSLELDSIRGAQGVLGPTVLVGPAEAAAGAVLAGLAAIAAGIVWLSVSEGRDLSGHLVRGSDALVVGLVVATAFWGPAIPWGSASSEVIAALGGWALVVVLVAGAAGGGSLVVGRLNVKLRWALLATALLATAVGAALTGENL
jgi:hypothetical protein